MSSLLAAGAFAAGVLLQSLLMLRGKLKRGDQNIIIFIFFFGLLTFLPGKNEPVYDFGMHLLWALMVYTFLLAIAFQRKLQSLLTPRLLLAWNLLFAYELLTRTTSPLLLIIGLLPVLLVAVNAVSRIDKAQWVQTLFYIWFLIILISITLFHFPFAHITTFWQGATVFGLVAASVPYWELFLTGISFFYIVVSVSFLLRLIPVSHRGKESVQKRFKEIHTDLRGFADNYVRQRAQPVINALYGLAIALVICVQHTYQFATDWTLIATGIVVLSFIERFTYKKHSDEQ